MNGGHIFLSWMVDIYFVWRFAWNAICPKQQWCVRSVCTGAPDAAGWKYKIVIFCSCLWHLTPKLWMKMIVVSFLHKCGCLQVGGLEPATQEVLLDLPGLLFFSTYTLLVLFWAEIYHQARSLSTSALRPIFISFNAVVYAVQVCQPLSGFVG